MNECMHEKSFEEKDSSYSESEVLVPMILPENSSLATG